MCDNVPSTEGFKSEYMGRGEKKKAISILHNVTCVISQMCLHSKSQDNPVCSIQY